MYKQWLFSIFLLLSFSLNSQEVKIFVSSQFEGQEKIKQSYLDTLQLPFWDDFSSLQISDSLWENNGCKIDIFSSINPPSIAVVEFDAMDNNENFYGTYEETVPSDMLISNPIDLYFPGDQSVYLSFMYQAGGRKDMPEENDSLLLQFYSPVDEQWTTVWYALGDGQEQDFKQVIINITDNKYLQKGFRFRFLNYTSLGSQNFASLVSNCDFWYVDYIYLDRNRYSADTIFSDIALQYPMQWHFDAYTALPFEHFNEYESIINKKLFIQFRNNDGVARTIDSLYIVFSNEQDNSIIDTLFVGSYSFPPYGNFFVNNEQVNYQFPIFTEELVLSAKTKLITDQFDPKSNNQAITNIDLINFYAYDDATAEAGYGLFGNGTYQAMVAARFYTYKDDYLRGVKIYFNKTFAGNQPHYFYLMVWENDPQTGMPGELIYEKLGMEIDFNNLGHYQIYSIDTLLRVTDTFYIGWKKTDEQLMNVGLDLNNIKPNYKFYNITGQWQKSTIEGNLMIRPIMGSFSTSWLNTNNFNVEIYPNPANDYLVITSQERYDIVIYNLMGQKLVEKRGIYNKVRLNVSNLPYGVYILQVKNTRNQTISRKILVY